MSFTTFIKRTFTSTEKRERQAAEQTKQSQLCALLQTWETLVEQHREKLAALHDAVYGYDTGEEPADTRDEIRLLGEEIAFVDQTLTKMRELHSARPNLPDVFLTDRHLKDRDWRCFRSSMYTVDSVRVRLDKLRKLEDAAYEREFDALTGSLH